MNVIKMFMGGILLTSTVLINAQEASSTTGGEASGTGGMASYTVGQTVFTTNTGSTGSVAQGVQQVYEISVVNGVNTTTGIFLSVTAYPNPTTDFLTLKIDTHYQLSDLKYCIYDLNGKLLKTGKITDNATAIDMNEFIPATYFIKIIKENKELETFKIIKH